MWGIPILATLGKLFHLFLTTVLAKATETPDSISTALQQLIIPRVLCSLQNHPARAAFTPSIVG